MDGRLRVWLTGGVLAASLPAVGCHLFNRNAGVGADGLPTPSNPVVQAGWRQPAAPAQFRPTENPAPVRTPAKKGQPFKAETLVAAADVELEVAFDDTRSAENRDQLIDVARRRLQDVLSRDPKNKIALLELAKVYTWAQDRERAAAEYQKAMQFHPKDADVPFAMMKSHIRFEDWPAAVKACEAALALDRENRTYRKAYGYVLARAGRWEEAFATLYDLEGEAKARTMLGYVLLNTGKLAEGRDQLQQAVNLDPQNTSARQLLDDLTEFQQQQGVRPAGTPAR